MQMAAPEAFDLSGESAETHALYGLEPGSTEGFGWQCLVARRLAERGVRFIELIDGDTNIDSNWDAHAKMATYNKLSRNVDQPIAALIKDLKRRGMLEETLVVWTTEFGRGVFVPSPGTEGRGHHSRNYCSWLAGGGIRGGMVYGSSDELGNEVTEDAVSVHDFQATILQQLGIDHERLTYRHAGRDYRLTDVHGRVVNEILK
jgi:membrane-anchored protein YejM (alkaline phosphatase superfamily)